MLENTLDCSARDWSCFIKVCFCSSRAHVSQLLGSIYYIPQLWLTESNSPEIFDEYTRRQYVAKAPERNPYGTEEEPAKFTDFDAFTKVRICRAIFHRSVLIVIVDSSFTATYSMGHDQSRAYS